MFLHYVIFSTILSLPPTEVPNILYRTLTSNTLSLRSFKVKHELIMEIWELITLYRAKEVNKINNVFHFPPPPKNKVMTSTRMYYCHSGWTTVNCDYAQYEDSFQCINKHLCLNVAKYITFTVPKHISMWDVRFSCQGIWGLSMYILGYNTA